MKAYRASKIVLEDKIVEDAYLIIYKGKIHKISKDKPINMELIDLGDGYLAPGLVDTHIHGYKNMDIMDAKPGYLNGISKGLLEMGVTSFLATTLTDSKDKLNKVCKIIGDEYQEVEGARVEGIFLEGPYFTEKYKGAQNLDYMKDPDIEELEEWNRLSKGMIKKVAIAPERDGAIDFIKKAREMGIYIALGHSDSSYKTAMSAIDAGASIFVHVYNAMSGLHHREPGMVGAAMNSDSYAELICDGHHVHPVSAKIIMEAKGRDKIALITDCMRAGGMEDGEYKLGDFPVLVSNGMAKLKDGGNLAGSILKLNQGVKNVYDWKIATAFEAIQMASLVAAKSVGIDDRCGKIEAGRRADMIFLTNDLELKQTFLSGELVYEK